MNIVLAVSILVALFCAAFVRCVSLYNLKYMKNIFEKTTVVMLIILLISTIVFVVEMLFNPFNIIL